MSVVIIQSREREPDCRQSVSSLYTRYNPLLPVSVLPNRYIKHAQALKMSKPQIRRAMLCTSNSPPSSFSSFFSCSFSSTCTVEIDGSLGKDGIDGIFGMDGMDGRDGIFGMDGMDGIFGMDGMDGKDGAVGACFWYHSFSGSRFQMHAPTASTTTSAPAITPTTIPQTALGGPGGAGGRAGGEGGAI